MAYQVRQRKKPFRLRDVAFFSSLTSFVQKKSWHLDCFPISAMLRLENKCFAEIRWCGYFFVRKLTTKYRTTQRLDGFLFARSSLQETVQPKKQGVSSAPLIHRLKTNYAGKLLWSMCKQCIYLQYCP